MSTTASINTAPRRYAMPWAATAPVPLLSPALLSTPKAQGMQLTITSAVSMAEYDPMTMARARAGLLTTAEVAQIMAASTAAADAMAKGRGTRLHWVALCSALNMAKAIEDGGVVRGLAGHLDNIEATLNTLANRAGERKNPPTWKAPALHFDEMDDMRLLVDLYRHQLQQLSYMEYRTACDLAQARVRSSGGEVVGERS